MHILAVRYAPAIGANLKLDSCTGRRYQYVQPLCIGNMQAVVLAAGEGTRMRPLTETVPKPMLPVADRPLVAHTVDAAVDAGATEIIFVVGYRADTVREHFHT